MADIARIGHYAGKGLLFMALIVCLQKLREGLRWPVAKVRWQSLKWQIAEFSHTALRYIGSLVLACNKKMETIIPWILIEQMCDIKYVGSESLEG